MRSGLVRFTPENVSKLPNSPGSYYLYGRTGNLLYCGWSSILRHRLQSYYQKDSPKEHPTKRQLRPRITFFSVVYRSVAKAKEIERRMKYRAPFNKQKAGRRRR